MQCIICKKVFKNKNGLSKHISRTHKLKIEEYTLKYIHDDIIPVCACGCGVAVKYNTEIPYTYRTYASGHYVYHHPEIWGDKSDPIRLAKGAKTYKKKYANGEIQHWSKGQTKENNSKLKNASELLKKENSPDRAKNISKKLKGVKKSEEHIANWKAKMQEHWDSSEFRNKLSNSHINHLINNHKHYTSKLETYFEENFLKPHNIIYSKFYYAAGIKKFYDFYISSLNLIIETDGDYWHCNPETFPDAISKAQKRNKEIDIVKNNWCKNNDIQLIRIWEADIYNRKEDVMKRLKDFGIG